MTLSASILVVEPWLLEVLTIVSTIVSTIRKLKLEAADSSDSSLSAEAGIETLLDQCNIDEPSSASKQPENARFNAFWQIVSTLHAGGEPPTRSSNAPSVILDFPNWRLEFVTTVASASVPNEGTVQRSDSDSLGRGTSARPL